MPLLIDPGFTVRADRTVRFRLRQPDAHTVRLVADFTHWTASPLALRRRSTGDWEAETAPLAEGVHFYKYIVDGRWMHDPAHPLVEDDGCGGWNSVFGVGGPLAGGPEDLRIVTLNLRTYQESEALLKLEQVAFTLAALDVDAVALQEVGEHIHDPGRPNAGEFIRTRLQALTGQSWQHEWRMAHMGFDVYREGVSLLSRSPMADVHEHRISDHHLARNALAATLPIKGARVRLVSTHVSWPGAEGQDQVRRLLDALAAESDADAVLLAGVFNATADDPQVQDVLAAGFADVAHQTAVNGIPFPTAAAQQSQSLPLAPAVTDAGRLPLASRIDYQFLRSRSGGKFLRPGGCLPAFNGLTTANVYQPRVSDHVGILGIYCSGEPAA